ncbi:hypothetical protein [Xanthobacter versatilis]
MLPFPYMDPLPSDLAAARAMILAARAARLKLEIKKLRREFLAVWTPT